MSSVLERTAFDLSLRNPWFFRVVRRELYRRYKDPERVHEAALRMMNEYDGVLRKRESEFDFPELTITIKGRRMKPFGTAAGLDKNGEALIPLSRIYGFLEPGTVVVNPREGNQRPRVSSDSSRGDLYNAQGFPSEGLGYFLSNIQTYRDGTRDGTQVPIYVSICGLPLSEEKPVEVAMQEMTQLLDDLDPYVDGFVWNPFSPNTAALAALRNPEVFKQHASLVANRAPEKLRLVKMGPYDGDKKEEWMKLAEAWLAGGGDGIVAVNTYMVPKEEVPSESWGYPSAGRSGRFLRPYRLRAVKEARQAFPGAIIFATGGIDDGDDAYETLKYADAVEGFTPYTFHGLGLLRKIMQGVSRNLRKDGYNSLEELRST